METCYANTIYGDISNLEISLVNICMYLINDYILLSIIKIDNRNIYEIILLINRKYIVNMYKYDCKL